MARRYSAEFTQKQIQLGSLIAQGMSNKEIAYQLGHTHFGVKEATLKLYRKCGFTGNRNNRAVTALLFERYIGCISS